MSSSKKTTFKTSPSATSQLPWQIIAAHIADSIDKPAILLDDTSRIHLVSRAFESVGGWLREDVVGRNWLETFTPQELIETARASFERAARGTVRELETDILTKEGHRLAVNLESENLLPSKHHLEQPGVILLTVTSVRRIANFTESSSDQSSSRYRARDIEYEVDANPLDFGRLVITASPSAPRSSVVVPSGAAAPRCFRVFENRDSACPDCPILRTPSSSSASSGASEWPRSSVRRRPDGYELVTAVLVPAKFLYRVQRQRLSDAGIAAIREAKLDAIATEAKLSDRERSVLEHLVLGRSLEDIGTTLGISVRTVKFHQTNILDKVGAASRADLTRLIL